MSETALAIQTPADVLEKVVVGGDLSKLTSAERLIFYQRTCESVGVNPLTRPFEYITLNNKLTLYARKDCTDQIRQNKHINTTILARERADDIYTVTARATMRDELAPGGIREDESSGAVSIAGLRGDALANALMKAETKAKRRVTLSIAGLGMLDETEVETVPGAKVFTEAELSNGHKAEAPKQRPTPPAPAKTIDEPQQRVPWDENEPPAYAQPVSRVLPQPVEPTIKAKVPYVHNAVCPRECGAQVWQAWCATVADAEAAKIPLWEFEPVDTSTVLYMGKQVRARLDTLKASQEYERQGATA